MFEKLSDEQKVVVSDLSPQIIVAAGPGTGKSICAAAKVVHLVQQRCAKPEEVLVLTQGEKCARQIQHLVDVNTNMTANSATIMSVSSFCSVLLEDFGVTSVSTPWVKEEHLVALVEENKHLFKLSKYDPDKRHDLRWRDLVDHFTKLESFGVPPEAYLALAQSLSEQANAQSKSVMMGGRTEKEKALMLQYRFEYAASHKEIADAYDAFTKLKESTGKFGLVDRLPQTTKLIAQESVRAQLMSRFKHIIIDQIEDWGRLDWNVLEALAFHPQSIRDRTFTVFGDDDLAIMEWAGAPRDAFPKLKTHLTNAKLLPLTINFRCNTEVLDAAKALISRNTGRLEQATGILKAMISHEDEHFSDLPSFPSSSKSSKSSKQRVKKQVSSDDIAKGAQATTNPPTISSTTTATPIIPPIQHLEFKTELDQIYGISELLSKLMGSESVKSTSTSSSSHASGTPSASSKQPSIGIITRFKSDALSTCKQLQAAGAPVPSPLIEYPEVKFLINILKTVLEPSDSHGLYDLLCSGMFSIPGSALAKITELHQRSSTPLRAILSEYLNKVLTSHAELETMTKDEQRLLKRAKKLLALLALLESKLGTDSMKQLVYRILMETKVVSSHRNPHSVDEEEESENIAKFISLIEDAEAKLQNTRPAFVWNTLKRVCTHTPAATGGEADESITASGLVPVRTVWASKGYEYDYVILPHITDDRFPGRLKRNELQELLHQAAGFHMKDSEHVSQMRRVLYTAMTRARKGVIFTYHTKSAHSRVPLKISRFVPEALGLTSAKFLPDHNAQPSDKSVIEERTSSTANLQTTTGVQQESSSGSKLSSSSPAPPHSASSSSSSSSPSTFSSTTTATPPRAHAQAPTKKESPVFGGGVFTLHNKGRIPDISIHALQVFLRCPLQFYQQFIINIAVPLTPLAIFQEAIGAVLHSISTQQVDHCKLSSFDKLRKTFDATWEAHGVNPVRNPEMYEQGMALSETLLDSEESHNDLIISEFPWKLAVTHSSNSSSFGVSATTSFSSSSSSSALSSVVVASTDPSCASSTTNTATRETSGSNVIHLSDSFQRVYSGHHVRHYLQYSENFPPEVPALQNIARVIAWAYYKHNRATPSQVIIEYITARFQMKMLHFTPTAQHMIEAETYLRTIAKQLMTGNFEAVSNRQNCKRCPFSHSCPSSSVNK